MHEDFKSLKAFMRSGRIEEHEEGVWIDLSIDENTEGAGILLIGIDVEMLTRDNFVF